MPKKSLRYYIFSELMMADDVWFDEEDKDHPPYSTFEHGEEYFDYLAMKVAKMLKKEKFLKER